MSTPHAFPFRPPPQVRQTIGRGGGAPGQTTEHAHEQPEEAADEDPDRGGQED